MGLSQQEFAAKLGKGFRTIQDWERLPNRVDPLVVRLLDLERARK